MGNGLKEALLQNWDYTMDVEDWSPPLRMALDGVDSIQAAWKPEGHGGNSIWETVSHLTYYKQWLLHRVKGWAPVAAMGANSDTFAVTATGEEAWQAAVAKLQSVHASLREAIETHDGQALPNVNGGESDFQKYIMSLILHDAFHTGQIILVRKLQGSWSPVRD